MVMRHLVVGGARSGKTQAALHHALEWSRREQFGVTYVSTAEALDDEMRARIARHRAERPATWHTIEAPRQLAAALSRIAQPAIVIVDCITLWLSNALLRDFDESEPHADLPVWDRERESLLALLEGYNGVIILVSNEVGSGIVPMAALSRRFQDEQGRLNQQLARLCDRVTLVVAGIEMPLKGEQLR
jgi:adenosylcobinamide kinase/adenosylcobinamide-phosphate guanylyltransferase